jgi:hypothetical protein
VLMGVSANGEVSRKNFWRVDPDGFISHAVEDLEAQWHRLTLLHTKLRLQSSIFSKVVGSRSTDFLILKDCLWYENLRE